MKAKRSFFFIFLLLLIASSCSTKKDAFLNRNFHAVTTEFNILYNGQNAFDEGIADINSKYEDDFWNPIPIEPIKFEDNGIRAPKFGGPGSSFNSGGASNQNNQNNQTTTFERAEEKATKAIQKHSMRIYGIERNPQIDEAYLLLGKSRYYTERFIPAIEAFNYIVKNYPKADLIDETKIWRAKSHIRIENEDVAIEDLLKLLQKEKITEAIKEKANTALAMAYQKKDSTEAVIDRLQKATVTGKDPVQRARNLFLLGQVYSGLNQRDSSKMVFERLATYKKAPYRFQLRAHMALADETFEDSSIVALIDRYKQMMTYWDHRNSIDIIQYHTGTLEEKRNKKENAILSYKNAIRFKKARPKIKSYSYERLAEIYFNSNEFFLASNYYDSVLKIEKEETLRRKKIQRKYNSLAAVITYESIVKKNDSILKLVLLEPDERIDFFEKYIAKVKAEDEKKREEVQKSIDFGRSSGSSGGGTQSRRKSRGKWYFYNPQSLSFGESEFQRVWGNRRLQDNWRWSDNQQAAKSTLQAAKNKKEVQITQTTNKYDLNTYLSQIPTKTSVIDSIAEERIQSLYELGLIYKEQFQKNQMALDRLERLLKLYPPKRLLLPTYFLLYEIYGEQEESKGIFYKRRILRKYPKTAYSRVIKGRDKQPNTDEEVEEIKKLYETAYKLYDGKSYAEAVSFIEQSLETIDNSPLIPKFELLKAYCLGKYESKETYKKALDKVFRDYPNSIEGRKASSISKKL